MTIELKGTKEQARVTIAKDVLKWIRLGRIQAKTGIYVASHGDYETMRIKKGGDTQKPLRKTESCDVCAKGAILYSMVMRHDALNLPRDVDASVGSALSGVAEQRRSRYMNQVFDQSILNLIETAFEGWWRPGLGLLSADAWRVRFPNAEIRLEAIMKNVIRNKGTFVFGDIPS